MRSFHRKEKAGRFGTVPVALKGNAATCTANTTTDVYLGGYPYRAVIGPKVSISTALTPSDTDGALTGILYKYDASATTAIALTAAFDLEGLTAKIGQRISLLATLTDAQRTMDEGDILYFTVTSDSVAIDTNVGSLDIVAELFVQE